MKTSKKLNKLIALAVLLGGVSYSSSVWATPVNEYAITIGTDGAATSAPTGITGVTLGDATYYRFIGIASGSTAGGDVIRSIITADEIREEARGISIGSGTNTIKFAGADSFIIVKSIDNTESYELQKSGNAYGIQLYGGTNTISDIGSITAKSSTSYNIGAGNAYGIFLKASQKTFKNIVAFATTGGTIKAYTPCSFNYGIFFDSSSPGSNEIDNVKIIEVGVDPDETSKKSMNSAYGIYASGSSNTVNFVSSGSITAKSNNPAYGIYTSGGTTTVSNLSGITVEGNSVSSKISFNNSNSTLNLVSSTIDATNNVDTVYASSYNSTIFLNLKAATTNPSKENGTKVSGKVTVKDKTTLKVNIDGYSELNITGTSKTGTLDIVNSGTLNLSGGTVDSVTSTGKTNVSGTVKAANIGQEVELKNGANLTATGISVEKTMGEAKGLYVNMTNADDTASASVGSITAKSSTGYVYGLYLSGGTNTISDLGSIKTNSTGSAMAYGIYTTGGKNTISFKGNNETPAQAITAKGSDALTSCSIETTGGSTTVNFENSILSGKVKQSGASTLTLNFNDGGVWKPVDGDVTGNIKVNVNAGGTIDTRATTTAIKTINLGTGGSFKATPTTEENKTIYPLISFDAWAKSDNTLDTDKITVGGTSGTIKLGSINVKDEATEAWTTAKEANLFSTATNNITITGESKTQTSQGWLYTFKGGANGKVSVTSELDTHTLPQIIQGSDAAAQYTNTYSLTANETLGKDLGTLNNEKRTDGLTIYGNSKTISKGTASNGTVTLAQATDILTLQDVTVSGFTKFADNAGTLNLSGVTFTGTTGADVITGTGKTVISGVVTADKNIAQQVELQDGANLTATSISVDSTGKVNGIYVNMANASDTASASVGTVMTTSTGDYSYGIYAKGKGTTTVTNLGSIKAEMEIGKRPAYGIYAKNENTDNTKQFSVSFDSTNGGTISAYSASSTNYGINFDTGSTGTSEVKNVKTITVGVKSGSTDSSDNSFGIYAAAGVNNVTFTGADSSITAKSSGSIAYGIFLTGGSGATVADYTISNLGSITMEATKTSSGAKAYGIHVQNKNAPGEESAPATFSVSLVDAGGSISAYSAKGESRGISFENNCTGTSEVKNVKTITAGVKSGSTDSSGAAYGIYAVAGVNNVTFIGADSSITAKSSGSGAYGIDLAGTNTISGLGSITVKTTATDKNAYGIRSYGNDASLANNVSFKGNGGQAITATAATAANAYSIYAKGQGATTVNFENSILSGKIHQQDTATLNLNFNDKGVWKPVDGDVSGNVNVTVKDGGTINTQNSGSIDSVDLGTGTLTFDSGSKIKIDVLVTATDITIDNFTAGKATGVITLADFNIKENAPTEALGEKSVYLITGDCSGITNYTVASDVQEVESENYRYSFSLSKDTTGLLLKVTMNGKGVADEISSGKKSTYYLNDDETLKKDLGTLDNSKRESNSFTIDGTVSKFDLNANGYKGVTIANPTDVMIVKSMKIKGFDTFATNSGNLTLEDVTFSDEPATAVNDIKNDGTLNVKGDTTFNKGIGGTGTTYIKGGANVVYKSTTPKSITNKVVIETNGKLDPCVSVFAEGVNVEVQNDKSEGSTPGTLILTPGTLYANIKQAEGAILTVKANDLPKGTTFMTGVDKASQLDVGNGTLIIDGAKKWGYYSLVSGKAVTDGTLKLTDLWLVRENVENFRPEYDIDNGVVTLEFRNIPLEVEGNTSALAGVQQGAISIVGEIADNIGDNLSTRAKPAEGGKYDKNVWATYINSKDSTDGMSMWRVSGNNDISYRGATVGVDFYTSEKAISGVALTYVTGDVTSNPMDTHINNKTKRYGVSLYNRVANGNNALTYDLGYSQGSNEISENSYQMVTADAKTRAYTLGAKYEYACNFEHSALVPFASVRYLRLNSNDYSNSNGFNTSVNNQNIFQPKLGVAWRGDFKMGENGWSFKPVAEVGYLWSLGGTQADGTFTTVNRSYNIEYDTADRSTFYGKLGMNFQNKNFTAGVFYRYAKGSSVKNNRWNVNMAWAF